LDAIDDILGVPSEFLSQRDFSKRLILMEEKSNLRGRNFHTGGWQNPRRKTTNEVRKFGGRLKEVEKLRPKIPTLEGCGKSKSCDDPTSSQTSPGLTRKELEVKRRSIYGRECKGRSEARTCNKCQTVAHQVWKSIFFLRNHIIVLTNGEPTLLNDYIRYCHLITKGTQALWSSYI